MTLPNDTTLESVTLIVRDRARALAFYRDLLGFTVAHDADNRITLAPPNGKAIITLNVRPDAIPKPHRTTGLYHVAILLPDRPSLGAIIRRLITAGYPLQGASDHIVSEALYLADPDGNGLEIYRDRPRDQWRFIDNGVAMATDPMDMEGVLAEAADFDGMPAATAIGHVHLHVRDLASAEHFYCDALGFTVMQRSYPGALFVAAGGYHHHLGLNIWAGDTAPPANAVGLAEVTIRVPKGVDDAVARLTTHGFTVERADHTATLPDMDGNRVRLIEA